MPFDGKLIAINQQYGVFSLVGQKPTIISKRSFEEIASLSDVSTMAGYRDYAAACSPWFFRRHCGAAKDDIAWLDGLQPGATLIIVYFAEWESGMD